MRNEILRELQSEYEQQRMRDAEEEDRRRETAVAACPELGRVLDERQSMIYAGVRGLLDGRSSAEELPRRMEVLNRRVTALLTDNGFAPDWLDPVYRCARCRDTGYVGEPVREICECMRRRFYARLYSRVGLETQHPQTFDTFDASIFSDKKLPERSYSQRDIMCAIRQKCEKWADSYPDVPQQNVLLMGQSGLGKTFLMHAMAERLLRRGVNVLVVSAYRYLELARKAYFSGRSEDLDSLLSADVLMVDDLGSEPLMESVTLVQWFNLINERQTRGLATVFSTNLMENELRARYSERIASRILDKRTGMLLQFMGDDVRRK